MNKKFVYLFICLGTLFLLPACKSSKSAADTSLKSDLKKLSVYIIDYKWFEGKCNASYAGGFNELSFVSNFRLKKDEFIWISVTGPLSIEGGRALITPDSVQMIDRINRKYYKGTFQQFCMKYNLPITFVQLQELIVGNVLNEKTLKGPSKTENDFKIFEENTKEYSKNVYINLINYTVDKIGLKDRLTQRELLLNFANYSESKGKLFSQNRIIEINTHHEKSTIQMQFSKFLFDKEVEFPFAIPERYEINPF